MIRQTASILIPWTAVSREGPAKGILDMVMRAGQGCSAFTKPAWYPGSEPGIIMRRFVHELIEMAPDPASASRTISNAAFVLRA